MGRWWTIWLVVLGIYLLEGCIEPFEPDVSEYDSRLVVDGLFSNSNEPSRVFLSRSFGLDQEEPESISGATVVIEEDTGNSVQLTEINPGEYLSNPDMLRGIPGRSYRLLINLPDGQRFESDWELLKEPSPIGTIRSEFEERIPDEIGARPVRGIQFYLSTEDPLSNTVYYRWEWVQTYIYNLPHPRFIEVDFLDDSPNGRVDVRSLTGSDFEGFQCYKTERSAEILTATTENLTKDEVVDFPLNFVTDERSQLYLRYTLLARQYAISQDYFEYLRRLEQVNETTGTLFDPIPDELFGNIKAVDQSEVPVLGYFGTGGVSELRIWVDREDLPRGFVAPPGPSCSTDTIPLIFSELYEKLLSPSNVLYDYQRNFIGTPIGFLLSQPECTSCADYDATNIPPEFWTN